MEQSNDEPVVPKSPLMTGKWRQIPNELGDSMRTTGNNSTGKRGHFKWEQEKEEFFSTMDQVGYWNVSVREFAKKTGVPEKTLEKYKKAYLDQLSPGLIKRQAKEAARGGLVALRIIQRSMMSKNEKVALNAAQIYLTGMSQWSEGMKKVGYKVADFEDAEITVHVDDKKILDKLPPALQKELARIIRKTPEEPKDDN